MKLKITIKGDLGILRYIVKSEDSSFVSPSGKKQIDTQRFFKRFKEIINDWPKFLINPRMQGGDDIEILFVDSDKREQYCYFKGYPPNYIELIQLMEGIENGRESY